MDDVKKIFTIEKISKQDKSKPFDMYKVKNKLEKVEELILYFDQKILRGFLLDTNDHKYYDHIMEQVSHIKPNNYRSIDQSSKIPQKYMSKFMDYTLEDQSIIRTHTIQEVHPIMKDSISDYSLIYGGKTFFDKVDKK